MLTSLFSEIATSGWLVNNLYQPDAGLWRCNLRKPQGEGDLFTCWAEAPTLEDVLMESIHQTSFAEFNATPESQATIDTTPTPSLLARLGLTKRTPFTDRRI